jgi:SAM-dependent methyltransferase
MNDDTYAVEAAVQKSHWWFVGRRRLLHHLLQDLAPQPSWRVLEVGAGTGANLPVWSESGVRQVVACDLSQRALRHAAGARQAALAQTDARELPFADGAFDVVVAADVLEHLDDDAAALREFARVLRPGGHVIVTVPAFPFLWGPQDVVAQHRRRYLRHDLIGLIGQGGFRVRRSFHFNYLLLLPIWIARRILLATKVQLRSENEINTRWLNALLTRIFAADIATAMYVRPPFGVSLCVVANKSAGR